MPIKKRLINCDFLNVSGFISNLSNKAKLLYFFFLTNCDDKGFVGNAIDLANTLDQCEQDFDNTLFQLKYSDAIHELVEKRLVYEFSDKVGNKTYLIRHWFYHNNFQGYLKTNYISYLAKVELVDNEYRLKTQQEHKEKNPLKGNEIKENKRKENEINKELEIIDNNKEQESDDNWEQEWDNFVEDAKNLEPKKPQDMSFDDILNMEVDDNEIH